MHTEARMLSVESGTPCARRRLIRSVRRFSVHGVNRIPMSTSERLFLHFAIFAALFCVSFGLSVVCGSWSIAGPDVSLSPSYMSAQGLWLSVGDVIELPSRLIPGNTPEPLKGFLSIALPALIAHATGYALLRAIRRTRSTVPQ